MLVGLDRGSMRGHNFEGFAHRMLLNGGDFNVCIGLLRFFVRLRFADESTPRLKKPQRFVPGRKYKESNEVVYSTDGSIYPLSLTTLQTKPVDWKLDALLGLGDGGPIDEGTDDGEPMDEGPKMENQWLYILIARSVLLQQAFRLFFYYWCS